MRPTITQIIEFCNQVLKGLIDRESLQSFLEQKNPGLRQLPYTRPYQIHEIHVDGDDPRWNDWVDEDDPKYEQWFLDIRRRGDFLGSGITREHFPVVPGKKVVRYILIPTEKNLRDSVKAIYDRRLTLPDRATAETILDSFRGEDVAILGVCHLFRFLRPGFQFQPSSIKSLEDSETSALCVSKFKHDDRRSIYHNSLGESVHYYEFVIAVLDEEPVIT